MMAVEVNGEKMCLSNVKGKYYAIGNVCTHLAYKFSFSLIKLGRSDVFKLYLSMKGIIVKGIRMYPKS
jgi:nitrite reductase/ring-hydroxylating ferredoxin subunit